MVLVLSSPRLMSQSPSANTARWTWPSSTTRASSTWPSRWQQPRTFQPSSKRATSPGRSTWCCCPRRSSGPRRACRGVRALSSPRRSSSPEWNRRPWGTTPSASACTASGGWRRRRSWERRSSTWPSSTCRGRWLCPSPWNQDRNSLWEHVHLFLPWQRFTAERMLILRTLTVSNCHQFLVCICLKYPALNNYRIPWVKSLHYVIVTIIPKVNTGPNAWKQLQHTVRWKLD